MPHDSPTLLLPARRSLPLGWILAVWAESGATLGVIVAELCALYVFIEGLLPPDVYTEFAISIAYVWVFTTFGVLGGYGFTNVVEKWKPK